MIETKNAPMLKKAKIKVGIKSSATRNATPIKNHMK